MCRRGQEPEYFLLNVLNNKYITLTPKFQLVNENAHAGPTFVDTEINTEDKIRVVSH